ncbi:MAG: acetyl/propionyl/methylcrotonyl-CoA carboxylase subunit alpha [Rhodobacteraceae bacterium]|nr:acetyl/propionyl/methylcrotonyl-CoA carboxylase subunit alpha [Paracoccaceae bacterium]PHR53923.1 MAG: 3-methylcrotonyl-CoA carboxylase [Robiginitomaculum sp.]
MKPPFSKILIANRGEIAVRVMKTAKKLGVSTVAVYSDADAKSLHVFLADEAVHIGPPAAAESYLKADKIIEAALATGAEAIHPGYGFLSENPDFVEAVEAAGLTFIGPSAKAIRAMGLKDAAKDLMLEAGVPVVPGYQGSNQDPDFLAAEADKIGYPVLIKARAGGGGKGMRKVDTPADFLEGLASAQREGKNAFGDAHVLIEKFITSPRHIEVQVFGDNHGNVVHLFERDCSLQRRHQKVIEEAPAPGMTDEVRAAITSAAVTAAKAISYSGAGTIEFIVDGSGPLRPDGFWFMEMNTRLQVEHPVTEAITGVDLVEWQLNIAAGAMLPLRQQDLSINGHAFEARLYAEDPTTGFLPATGILHHLSFDASARNDTGVRTGDEITPWYDPMIAKVITHANTRNAALAGLITALQGTHVAGTATNARFLADLASHKDFKAGQFDTGLIERDLDSLTCAIPPSIAHVVFAGIAALGIDPAAQTNGWRLWGAAQHRLKLVSNDDVIDATMTLHADKRISLAIGDDSITLLDVAIDGTQITARVGDMNASINAQVIVSQLNEKRLISVLTGGVSHDLYSLDPRSGSADSTAHANAVTAPMTGVIIQLTAAVGTHVQEGDKLGVMEAMKMETALVAPRDGVIAEVFCAVGETVEGGATLILFQEDAE